MKEQRKNQERPNYPLRQIYFYLTEGCNLNCRHCWIEPVFVPHGRGARSLSPALFDSVIEQALPLGLKSVKLTGGEPLISPGVEDILETVRRAELRLVVETNGVLCSRGLAEKMAACRDPFVSVSLDGSDARTHEAARGVDGCFEGARRGIGNLVKAGFSPQIIMTVTRHNRDQVEGLVRLAEELGAGSVKFNLTHPVARGARLRESGETLSIKELIELGAYVENELSASTRLRLVFSHPPAFKPLSRMFGERKDGSGVCEILSVLGVLADGSYALCGIGETVPELVFGSVETDGLAEVWEGAEVLDRIRSGMPARLSGVCGRCLMRSMCRGYCLALNYYRTKNLWAPCWFCDEALAAGLFPETRLAPPDERLLA